MTPAEAAALRRELPGTGATVRGMRLRRPLHLVTGVLMCLTVIGIPLGLANFKLIPVSLTPFGRDIVDLEQALGLKYYTFVSQVENGFGRVPTESLEAWARALRIEPSAFARELLAYYEPELHRLLFGGKKK